MGYITVVGVIYFFINIYDLYFEAGLIPKL